MDSFRKQGYIFDHGQNRELITIIRLICGSGALARHHFGEHLNWSLPYVWLGLRLPHKRLLKGIKHSLDKFQGDVDVCGGSLQSVSQAEYDRCFNYWQEKERHRIAELPEDCPAEYRDEAPPLAIHNLASLMLLEQGKIKWSPDLSDISAIEVKSSWYSAEDDLKATGDKYEGRDQALALCKLGFNRVALAKFVVTQPRMSNDSRPGIAWTEAAHHSARAVDEYLNDENKGVYVKAQDPYGTVVIDVGTVPGKLENVAGTLGWKWLREVPDNPLKERAAEARKAMEETLGEVMSRYPVPTSVPIFILACSDDKCGNLFVERVSTSAACPQCGKPPRSAPIKDVK